MLFICRPLKVGHRLYEKSKMKLCLNVKFLPLLPIKQVQRASSIDTTKVNERRNQWYQHDVLAQSIFYIYPPEKNPNCRK